MSRSFFRVVSAVLILSFSLFPLSVSAGGPDPDYAEETGSLTGICVTVLPESGSVMLGSRQIRPGDVLTPEQLAALIFLPEKSGASPLGMLSYLPVFGHTIASETAVALSIRGRADLPPVAEDFAAETYKNLPLEALLPVSDPEEQTLTYTLIRSPRRGEVVIREDGSFLYTPRKNKVGTDSFVFTATDTEGNVSREATVTIRILKPADSLQYADTLGTACRFEAEWMRNTGIFSGEQISGQLCFAPETPVSRGQFLAMLMDILGFPVDRSSVPSGNDSCPVWLAPYVDAGIQAGILSESSNPDWNGTITGSEAQQMVHNALLFLVPTAQIGGTSVLPDSPFPLNIPLFSTSETPLTRSDTAIGLYRVSKLRSQPSAVLSLLFSL